MIGSNSRELSIVLKLQDQVSSELKGVQGRLESLRPTFNRMAGYGTAAFAGITAAIGVAANEARKAEDIESLFTLAFGNIKDEASDAAQTFADEFGRSESRIKDSLARVAFQFEASTNLSEEQMLRLSESMLPAAEGLALLDTNVEDGTQVMQAFSDALAGQNQQLGRMIGGYQESDIKTQALKEGIIEEGEELDRTARALALHSLFMDRTTASQEKMNEENRGTTDALIQLKDAVQTFKEAAGDPFLGLLKDIMEEITPIVQGIGEWVEENPELTKVIVLAVGALAGLVALLGTLGILILTVGPAVAFLATPFGIAVIAVMGLVAAGLYMWKNWEQVKKGLGMIWDAIKKIFWKGVDLALKYLFPLLPGGAIIKGIVENWDTIKEYLATALKNIVGVFSWAKDKIMSFLDPIIETAKKAIDLARRAKEMAGGAISGARDRVSSVIDRVTPFANGGIVTRPTMGLVGEAGPEAVIPLNKAGGFGGVTVNVYGDVSGRELVEKVKYQLSRELKR